jgi:hypothetical protein
MTVPDGVQIRNHEIFMPERTEPWPVSLEELVQEESATPDGEEGADLLVEESETFDVPAPTEPENAGFGVPHREESPYASAETTDSVEYGTDVAAVVQALFAPGITTSQTTEQFEEAYKDKKAVWSGTLSSVRSYRFDLVFGDVPGTRAEFEIDPKGTVSTGRPAKAVVQFAAEEEDRLRALVDRQVEFRGVLFSCDAFMKTLFLVNGQIIEVVA